MDFFYCLQAGCLRIAHFQGTQSDTECCSFQHLDVEFPCFGWKTHQRYQAMHPKPESTSISTAAQTKKKKSSIQNIKQGISSWQAFGYVLVRRWSPCSTQRKILQICKRIVTCSLNLKNYIGNPPKRTKGRLKITNKTMNVWAHKIKKPR